MRSMWMPRRGHQAESLLKPKSAWLLANGTRLSLRIALWRDSIPNRMNLSAQRGPMPDRSERRGRCVTHC